MYYYQIIETGLVVWHDSPYIENGVMHCTYTEVHLMDKGHSWFSEVEERKNPSLISIYSMKRDEF